MLSTSPSLDTSARPHLPIPLYFMPFRICLMIPPSSPVHHSLTGLLIMDTFTIRVACMYRRPLGPLSFTPSILPPSWATSDVFAPRPLLNMIFGGQDFLCLSITSSPAVLFANKTRLTHTLSPHRFLPSNPLLPCHLNNCPSTSSQIYPFLMDMTL